MFRQDRRSQVEKISAIMMHVKRKIWYNDYVREVTNMEILKDRKRIVSLFLIIVIMSGCVLLPTKVMATDIVLESEDTTSNKKFS